VFPHAGEIRVIANIGHGNQRPGQRAATRLQQRIDQQRAVFGRLRNPKIDIMDGYQKPKRQKTERKWK